MFRSLWFPRLRKSSGTPSHWLYKVLQLSTINHWKIHSTWAKLSTYHWFWCHIANLQFYWQAAKMQKEETFLILWLLLVKVYFQFLVKKIMIFALIILSLKIKNCAINQNMNEVVALFSSFKSVLKGPPFCTKHFKVCAAVHQIGLFLPLSWSLQVL